MLDLLAVALEDGWAFIKNGKDIFLIRPPYKKGKMSKVTDNEVEKAVSIHGFIVATKSFDNWESLISYLKEQMVTEREKQGQAVPGKEAAVELLHRAPLRILEDYLNRIETELLPNKEFDAVLELLTLIIGLEKIKKDTNLFNRTHDLLERCSKELLHADREKRELINEEGDLEIQFPRSTKRHGADNIKDCSVIIFKNHCLMPVGSS